MNCQAVDRISLPCYDCPMNSFGKQLLRWLPALVIMTGIFLLSATPSRDLPDFGGWDLFVKKMGHLSGFAGLGLAYLRGIGPWRRRAPWLALALVVLYAVSDELHQSLVPGRTPAWYDVLIDTSGASLSLYFAGRLPLLRKLVQWGELTAPTASD